MSLRTFVTGTVFCVLTASAFAQSAAPAPGTVGDRKYDQQQRIAKGVQDGQLTPRETANLEHREGSINREERNMRRQDNGHLTNRDRRVLNNRQNHASKAIYRDKHNARRQR